jgi:hypothetical protein
MKLTHWLALLMCAMPLLGCSSAEPASAEDDKFMSDLEAAAAKNGNKAPSGKRMGGASIDSTSTPTAPGGANATQTTGQ